MEYSFNIKNAKNFFNDNGYFLLKEGFASDIAFEASEWLKSQNLEQLASTWTEQEPGVPLAVYQNIHKGNSPISQIASNPEMLKIASHFMNDNVYIWSSKVNLKAAWCGAVEYYHQDYVYWADRGYKNMNMMSCMVFLEDHGIDNGGLRIFPGSHKEGFLNHEPFININGLSKFMVPPESLNQLNESYGYKIIEAKPGDVLFFHAGLVHGSSHNISHQSRMVILSQLNARKNVAKNAQHNAKKFNLKRSKMELEEAERRLTWFKNKYESQLNSEDVKFNSPIPDEEINSH